MHPHGEIERIPPEPPIVYDDSLEPPAELQQRDVEPPRATKYPPVAMVLDGIGRVRSLPARRMSTGVQNIAKSAEPVGVLGAADQRLSLRLRAYKAGVYLSSDRAGARTGYYLPVGADETWDYSGPLFAYCGGFAPDGTTGEPAEGCFLSWAAFLVED